jgi:hypothetical protein
MVGAKAMPSRIADCGFEAIAQAGAPVRAPKGLNNIAQGQ